MNGVLVRGLDVLLLAVLGPLGLALAFLLVHLIALAWRVTASRTPTPVVVQLLSFEHHRLEFVGSQPTELLELPSRLRDYLAGDSTSLVELAPGPVGPITTQLPTAVADGNTGGWASQLSRTLSSRYRPVLNIVLVPEVPRRGLSVGVQIVHAPSGQLLAARSIPGDDVLELAYLVGGFCAGVIFEQPRILRRTPRWGHWKNNAYTQFRIGLHFERLGDGAAGEGDKDNAKACWEYAHAKYTEAARRCPGSGRIALVHGNVHEKLGDYAKAAEVYEAAACLWPQNVDISYRVAAAKVNRALVENLGREGLVDLVTGANDSLRRAARALRRRSIIRSYVRTFLPSNRDYGERAYWRSWFRPERYRRHLRFLRRSRRHEYRAALLIAIESNELLLWNKTKRECTTEFEADALRSWRLVVKTSSKRRAGWLAHWTAACYFSRLTEIRAEVRPARFLWLADRQRVLVPTRAVGVRRGGPESSVTWTDYCEERAVAEIGRVVRNPCSQFDARRLQTDPDMTRLQRAFKAQRVAMLAGVVWDEADEAAPVVPSPRGPMPPDIRRGVSASRRRRMPLQSGNGQRLR